jgi:hypothetical protein
LLGTLLILAGAAAVFALGAMVGGRFLFPPRQETGENRGLAQAEGETERETPTAGDATAGEPEGSEVSTGGEDSASEEQSRQGERVASDGPTPEQGSPESGPEAPAPARVGEAQEGPLEGARPAQNETPTSADPRKQAVFRKALGDARVSLSERDLAGAAEHLATAAGAVQSPEDAAELARMQTLNDHLTEFWKGIRQSVSGLHGSQELKVGESVIVVVEASEDSLVVRAAGRNYRFGITEIPHKLVMVLANQWFADDPSSRVLMGTYLAVDRDGDLAQARQLWERAASEGAELADLMPELAHARATGSGAAGGKIGPPTDESKLAEARRQVRARFQVEFDSAANQAGKVALAEKLVEASSECDDLVTRYVMLVDARDTAASAGEAGLAVQAIDALDAVYAIDALDSKTSVLVQASESVRGLSGQKEVAQCALELIPKLAEAKRLDQARRVAEVAVASAKEARNVSLLRQARAVHQQVEALRQQQD